MVGFESAISCDGATRMYRVFRKRTRTLVDAYSTRGKSDIFGFCDTWNGHDPFVPDERARISDFRSVRWGENETAFVVPSLTSVCEFQSVVLKRHADLRCFTPHDIVLQRLNACGETTFSSYIIARSRPRRRLVLRTTAVNILCMRSLCGHVSKTRFYYRSSGPKRLWLQKKKKNNQH